MVKILTVLLSTIYNSQVFILKKSHVFSKNISIYAIFNNQSFNDTLNNDIVSFEQLGPGLWKQRNTLNNPLIILLFLLSDSEP